MFDVVCCLWWVGSFFEVGCWVLVDGCSSCLFVVVCCLLFAEGCLLLVYVSCGSSLSVMRCLLSVLRCLLSVGVLLLAC